MKIKAAYETKIETAITLVLHLYYACIMLTSCREWTGRVVKPTTYIPPRASSWIFIWDFRI